MEPLGKIRSPPWPPANNSTVARGCGGASTSRRCVTPGRVGMSTTCGVVCACAGSMTVSNSVASARSTPRPCSRARPNRAAERARARAASVSRSRGSAVVTSALMRLRAAAATSSTAQSKAAALALDGTLKPLSLRTNCSDASRISSSVAGGSKLNRVLMLRHMATPPKSDGDQTSRRSYNCSLTSRPHCVPRWVRTSWNPCFS